MSAKGSKMRLADRHGDGPNPGEILIFHCPGCKYGHGFNISGPPPVWTYNGNEESPTLSPSLLYTREQAKFRCHSFVRDGMIQFLGDCDHPLAGQTVPLPPW